MNVVSPIPRRNLPQYGEGSILRPERDSDAIGRQWVKNRRNGAQVHGITDNSSRVLQEFQKLRRRWLAPDICFPFKIVPVAPENCIDPSTAGRTFQVISGFAGFRPKWRQYDNIGHDVPPGFLIGNYEVMFQVIQGAAPINSPDFGLFLPSVAEESVFVSNSGVFGASGYNSAEFVLSEEYDAFQQRNAQFFLVFTDSDDEDTNPTIEIMCNMFTFDVVINPLGRSAFEFPTDPTVIPIGAVYQSNNGELDANGINQWTVDHVLNRYGPPPGNLTTSSIGPMFYRGEWDNDSLSGQMFYPGDVVTRENQIISAWTDGDGSGDIFTLTATKTWVHIGYGREDDPPPTSGQWRHIAFEEITVTAP